MNALNCTSAIAISLLSFMVAIANVAAAAATADAAIASVNNT